MTRAKWFLFDDYLTDSERVLLQQLDSGPDLPARQGPTERARTMRALLDKGVIAAESPATPEAEFSSLQEAYTITSKGREYLKLVATTPAADADVEEQTD